MQTYVIVAYRKGAKTGAVCCNPDTAEACAIIISKMTHYTWRELRIEKAA